MEFTEVRRLLDPEPTPPEMGIERLGDGVLHVAVPDEVGLGPIGHSHAEWLYLAGIQPALFVAERRDVVAAPAAW